MVDLSRRSALTLLIASCAVGVSACAPAPTGSPAAAPAEDPVSPTPDAGSAPTPVGGVFGPTGAHWPSRTPAPTDEVDVTIDVDCSWSAIAAAITDADTRAPEGTAIVRVAPGTLTGSGAGSTKPPVLSSLGRTGRPFRILVVPRDGVGSVRFDKSIRIDDVAGVAFVGFWLFPWSVVLTSVRDVAWAWSKGQAFNITSGGSGPVEGVELVECVTPDASAGESDTWAFRTGENPYRDITLSGCYLAPTFKPDESGAHCDTLQLSGNELKTGLVIRDTVLFASTNAGFIPSAGATGIVFDHSLVVGGDRMLERFALPPGADPFTSGLPAAINGAGSVDQMSARGSVFVGNVRGTFLEVADTVVSATEPPAATSGSFTSDPALADIDTAWLDAQAPLPDDAALERIWAL